MTIEQERDELSSRVTALESDLSAANSLIEELQPVSARVAELESQLSAQGATLTDAQAEVTRLTTELESLRAETPSSSEQAAAIVAGIGIPEVGAATDPQATKSHTEIFSELKGAEKTAYFRKYRAELFAGK